MECLSDEEMLPHWHSQANACSFRGSRPRALTDGLTPRGSPLSSNRGQHSRKGAASVFADNCDLQMKWQRSHVLCEANERCMQGRISKLSSPSAPVRSPHVQRTGDMENAPPQKDGRPVILSLSKLDWAKMENKSDLRKLREIKVCASDLVRCNGDLQELSRCQLHHTTPQGDAFKTAFELRCRKREKLRDPWKGVPNPEATRVPTDKDHIMSQIWQAPQPDLLNQKWPRLPFDLELAEALRKNAKLKRPTSNASTCAVVRRRHSFGGDSATRPSSAASTRASSSASTRPSSAESSIRRSTSNAVPARAVVSRRHSWGGESSSRPSSAGSTRPSSSSSTDPSSAESSIRGSTSSAHEASESPARPRSRPGTANRRHSFGPGDKPPMAPVAKPSPPPSNLPPRERLARRRSL